VTAKAKAKGMLVLDLDNRGLEPNLEFNPIKESSEAFALRQRHFAGFLEAVRKPPPPLQSIDELSIVSKFEEIWRLRSFDCFRDAAPHTFAECMFLTAG
jgi:hypothetical protein